MVAVFYSFYLFILLFIYFYYYLRHPFGDSNPMPEESFHFITDCLLHVQGNIVEILFFAKHEMFREQLTTITQVRGECFLKYISLQTSSRETYETLRSSCFIFYIWKLHLSKLTAGSRGEVLLTRGMKRMNLDSQTLQTRIIWESEWRKMIFWRWRWEKNWTFLPFLIP